MPATPTLLKDDGSGKHTYAVLAVGVQGDRTPASAPVTSAGLATLRWDGVPGADAYVVLRDGRDVTGPVRIEGAQKAWTDTPKD